MTGRVCTYISLEVQLDLGVLAGVLMYGLDTAIQHSTNRTTFTYSELDMSLVEAEQLQKEAMQELLCVAKKPSCK